MSPDVQSTSATTPSAGGDSVQSTAAPAGGGGSAPGTINAKEPIKSLEDLKHKAPKVYFAMLQGIASQMCREMQQHADRLKEQLRKAYGG